MQTITLVDGTTVNGHILENGDGQMIFVYLDGMSVVEGVVLFSDRGRTEEIRANSYGHEYVYRGFTELWSANHEFGNCNLIMKKRTV